MMVLKPFAVLYGWINGVRTQLFDKQVIGSVRLSKPVLVVGNITAGGTGKTPFVDYIIQLLNKNQKKVGIISRGYKGSFQGVAKVNGSAPRAALTYGDEPVMLSRKHPAVPIYLHPQRALAGQALLKNEALVNVVVCDDGFQHRALQRDFNIVLIDCTEKIKNYRLLPQGRLREPLSGLKRAHFIVFTKVNWASPQQVQATVKLIGKHFDLRADNHGFAHYICKFPPQPTGPSTLLVSSIAKPHVLKQSVEDQSNFKIKKQLVFSDHHIYKLKDINYILREFKKSQSDIILTTEKDHVKLREFPQLDGLVQVIKIDVTMTDGEGVLKNEIFKIVG